MDRMFENEIPSEKYRLSSSAPLMQLSSSQVDRSSGQGPAAIELKFVNELGQPVVNGGPVRYYGQQTATEQQKRRQRTMMNLRQEEIRGNYESVSDNHSHQQFLLTSLTDHQSRTQPVNPHQQQRLQFYSIEFQLRPLSERGLLVFFGAFDNELDEAVGFVSLSLQGGVVEFRVSARKDHRVTVLRSNRILAIGEWHKIRFSQSGRRLSLWVEGSAVTTTTEYNGLAIHKGTRIFFGGLPDLSKLPLTAISGFPVPYRGCVRQVVVSGVRVVLNETNIKGT